jgi:hypothetical protein
LSHFQPFPLKSGQKGTQKGGPKPPRMGPK